MKFKTISIISHIKSVSLLLAATWLLASCTVTRYQRVETAWSKKKDGEMPTYYTPDSLLKISYNLWEEGGKVKCKIENRGTNDIFIVPYYTVDIVQLNDTSAIADTLQCVVRDSTGRRSIRPTDLMELITEGIDIPIPAKGSMYLNTTYINQYTDFNYDTNNPAAVKSVFYGPDQTPFNFTKQIAYVRPGETDITVTKHSFYINFIYPYTYIARLNKIPETKRTPNSFYLLSKRTGPLTYIGAGAAFIGVIILSVLGENDGQ
jgi:hypothetical protein